MITFIVTIYQDTVFPLIFVGLPYRLRQHRAHSKWDKKLAKAGQVHCA